MESELHNHNPKTQKKNQKTLKRTNKLNLALTFTICELFGNEGRVNELNWFNKELDISFNFKFGTWHEARVNEELVQLICVSISNELD